MLLLVINKFINWTAESEERKKEGYLYKIRNYVVQENCKQGHLQNTERSTRSPDCITGRSVVIENLFALISMLYSFEVFAFFTLMSWK